MSKNIFDQHLYNYIHCSIVLMHVHCLVIIIILATGTLFPFFIFAKKGMLCFKININIFFKSFSEEIFIREISFCSVRIWGYTYSRGCRNTEIYRVKGFSNISVVDLAFQKVR